MFNIIKIYKKLYRSIICKHSLCNKQSHGEYHRLKETLTSMSHWILTVHLKKSSPICFPAMALFSTITDQCPAIICHHVRVPTTLVSYFHRSNVLMEPPPLFLANITKILWETYLIQDGNPPPVGKRDRPQKVRRTYGMMRLITCYNTK